MNNRDVEYAVNNGDVEEAVNKRDVEEAVNKRDVEEAMNNGEVEDAAMNKGEVEDAKINVDVEDIVINVDTKDAANNGDEEDSMNNGVVEHTFLWMIENFSYYGHKTGFTSPKFSAEGLEGTVYRLWLYPEGYRDEGRDHISISLERCWIEDGPRNFPLKFKVYFLAADKSVLRSRQHEMSLQKGEHYAWPTFVQSDEVLLRRNAEYLPNDILTVRCVIRKREGKVKKTGQSSARTHIGVEKVAFIHQVKGFSALEPNQDKPAEIRSFTKSEGVITSKLFITVCSCNQEMIVIEIKHSETSHILFKCKISVIAGSEHIIGCGEADNRFHATRKAVRKIPLSLSRQDILSRESEYLANDTLSLLCECTFSTGEKFDKTEDTWNVMPISTIQQITSHYSNKNVYNFAKKIASYPNVSEDLKAIYINKSLTDVELKTKTKSFPAHGVLLCARSPVFFDMLTNEVEEQNINCIQIDSKEEKNINFNPIGDTEDKNIKFHQGDNIEEKNTKCIQVDDFDDNIVEKLLLFLYSDKLENLQWKTAVQLYQAAFTYKIGKLKEICSSFLVKNLRPSKASEVLLLADGSMDSDLKNVVEDFILEHEEQVLESKEGKRLIETNPKLVINMLRKYKKKCARN